MKKSILLVTVFILAACTSSPQVTTATPEVTVTSVPIPTPTLHPQFAALQEQIAASGTRFTLNSADGLVYDSETPIPGLHVSPDGTTTLTVNGETVTLDPAKAVFDDNDGFSYPRYEYDESSGEWVQAISEAMQQTTALLDQYSIDPETVTVTEEGGAVNVTDNETGTVLIRTIEGQPSKFDLGFAVDVIAPQSCEPTPFVPSARRTDVGGNGRAPDEYVLELMNYFSIPLAEKTGLIRAFILLQREDRCWGFVVDNDLLWRDANHVPQRLSLMAMPDAKLYEWLHERYEMNR